MDRGRGAPHVRGVRARRADVRRRDRGDWHLRWGRALRPLMPMFAVVTEAIGIFGGDERYDRLSKEFTRLLLVAYSATAIWGAILVFFLATLYPRFWAYLTAVFGASMWVYASLFFVESFTLYLYYYGWDRWKRSEERRVGK